MELRDYSKGELITELMRRGVVKAHTVISLDKMQVGRRVESPGENGELVGVRLSSVRKMRLFLSLPDIEVETSSGEPDRNVMLTIAENPTLIDDVRWNFDAARGSVESRD